MTIIISALISLTQSINTIHTNDMMLRFKRELELSKHLSYSSAAVLKDQVVDFRMSLNV